MEYLRCIEIKISYYSLSMSCNRDNLISIITWIDRFLLIMRATKLLGFGDKKRKSTNCKLPFYLFFINSSLL